MYEYQMQIKFESSASAEVLRQMCVCITYGGYCRRS